MDGGEIGATDGEEIGAKGSYMIILGLWSRAIQGWSGVRTNNLIGLSEEFIVDAGAFPGLGTKASVLLFEEIIK